MGENKSGSGGSGRRTGDTARDLLTPGNAGHDTIVYRSEGDAAPKRDQVSPTVLSESLAAVADEQRAQ